MPGENTTSVAVAQDSELFGAVREVVLEARIRFRERPDGEPLPRDTGFPASGEFHIGVTQVSDGRGMEPRGIEPLTSRMQAECSTS